VILCSKSYAIALVKCLFYEDYEQCNIAIALFVADGKVRSLCTRCYAIALVKCLFYEDYEQHNIAIAISRSDSCGVSLYY
jgi:hypothetical protein